MIDQGFVAPFQNLKEALLSAGKTLRRGAGNPGQARSRLVRKGTANGRIIWSEVDRTHGLEVSFHATKGYRFRRIT